MTAIAYDYADIRSRMLGDDKPKRGTVKALPFTPPASTHFDLINWANLQIIELLSMPATIDPGHTTHWSIGPIRYRRTRIE